MPQYVLQAYLMVFPLPFFSFIWCTTYYLCNVFLHGQLRSIYVHSHIPTWRLSMLICLYPNDMYNSMTQLLSHTFAHLTGPSFILKAKLLPNKIVLGLTSTCIKVVENCKILTFKDNFLHQKLSESF